MAPPNGSRNVRAAAAAAAAMTILLSAARGGVIDRRPPSVAAFAVDAFVVVPRRASASAAVLLPPGRRDGAAAATMTVLSARRGGGGGGGGGGRVLRPNRNRPSASAGAAATAKKGGGEKKPTAVTLEQLAKRIASDSNAALAGRETKKKGRRTRRRVDRPKQTYVYASQRRRMERDGAPPPTASSEAAAAEGGAEGAEAEEDGSEAETDEATTRRQRSYPALELARSLGLNPSAQGCFPVAGDFEGSEPRIVGEVRVEEVDDDDGNEEDEDDDEGTAGGGGSTGIRGYVIDKPAGWSILGDGGKRRSKKKKKAATAPGRRRRGSGGAAAHGPAAGFYDDPPGDGDSALELDESDLLATMTPEERAEFEADGGLVGLAQGPGQGPGPEGASAAADDGRSRRRALRGYDDDGEELGVVDFDESDFLAALTPEERAEFLGEGGFDGPGFAGTTVAGGEAKGGSGSSFGGGGGGRGGAASAPSAPSKGDEAVAAASEEEEEEEAFRPQTRPSVVSWLKSLMASRGRPIRGGKYWRAVAGATETDDSGLVVLCPRDRADAVHVDYATYVAAVGNGGKLAPRGRKNQRGGGGAKSTFNAEEVEVDTIARLRRHRGDDPVTVVALSVPDGTSTCSDAARLAQIELDDGIRGDPVADPLDRRAPRRLVHCGALSVSSLVCDDDVEVMTDPLPDDVANLAERRDNQEYARGSFLGRQNELHNDKLTTCYREINGAADGYPGWVVDRYDKWLLVQHDPSRPRGPLPSIHDGSTAGVYYYPTAPDRSVLSDVRPTLIEGRPAPDEFQVVENGVVYRVRLSESFSTGLFLDQRPQRAWLAGHCTPRTRVLNCFAHCGAFSVAAATAGARTVSLDLDRKWLDRVRPQMEDNGVEDFDERHDCIYGDCFDWLSRLSKRGETFDVVILDPPSTSVGGRKKRRWSLRKDMDELVALAVPLVKRGGLLWTTTNAAGVSHGRFANICRRGLERAGVKVGAGAGGGARLERVAPMPSDFPSVGPPPVKNLVWRMPP